MDSRVLRSYSWAGAVSNLDVAALNADVQRARTLDNELSDARRASNEMISLFDRLEALSANVPLLGNVSAMDVLRTAFSEVDDAEALVRDLDAKLDSLSANADVVKAAADRIGNLNASSVSGADMDELFGDARGAASGLQSNAAYAIGKVSDLRRMTSLLEAALSGASDTPAIGDSIADGAATAAQFRASLSFMESVLRTSETALASLLSRFGASIQEADGAHDGYVVRWLQNPYATQQTVVVAPTAIPTSVPTAVPTPSDQPFALDWNVSPSGGVDGGDNFTLTVRMRDVRNAGEHGGISVSFPSITRAGGGSLRHSSAAADVRAVSYTSGLSRVAFHQPGATIHHKVGNRQFAATYLLVESDDPTWTASDDRTLTLRITPKKGGAFPIQVRGWVCASEYANCAYSPTTASASDQQGHAAEVASVAVSGDAPQQVANAVRLTTGTGHTCGLNSDGSVTCWGDNDHGQASPPEGARFVSLEGRTLGDYSCGLRADGTALCWGDNEDGRASPPLDERFSAISGGAAHGCGLRASDGSVVCWGDNEYGQASPPSGSFIAISAGGRHSCGVRSNGVAACWGSNDAPKPLVDKDDKEEIGQASPPASERFTAISAGYWHTCGLRSNGAAVCWGANRYYFRGGPWLTRDAGQAEPSAGDFTAISAGFSHTCGLRSDGAAVCWGYNEHGQASPPPGNRYVAVSVGGRGLNRLSGENDRHHSCGLKEDNLVVCWGENEDGQSNPRALR